MLPKHQRLTTSTFERVFKRGRRVRVNEFLFIIAPAPVTRMAAVVSKKVVKSAPKRNRIRRQIYAQMREHLLPVMPGKQVICLYNGAESMQNPAAFSDVARILLQKLNRPGHKPRRRKNKR